MWVCLCKKCIIDRSLSLSITISCYCFTTYLFWVRTSTCSNNVCSCQSRFDTYISWHIYIYIWHRYYQFMINVCIYLSLFTFFEACFSQLVFLFWWQHHLIFLSIPQDCFRLPPNKFLDGLVASASQSRHVSTLRPSIDRDWQRFVKIGHTVQAKLRNVKISLNKSIVSVIRTFS